MGTRIGAPLSKDFDLDFWLAKTPLEFRTKGLAYSLSTATECLPGIKNNEKDILTNKSSVQNNLPNNDTGKDSIPDSISKTEPNICINAFDDDNSIIMISELIS